MIIPTRRFMWLAAVPLVVVLNGRGTPGAIETAWILMGVIIAAFVADGFIIRTQAQVRLDREAPAQLYVEQPNRIGWVIENPNAFPLELVLSDRVPAGATADPHVLELKAPPRSRTTLEYELVPTAHGLVAFGDLDFRVRGRLGLAWSQQKLRARLEVPCLPHLANAKAAELAERRALLRQAGSHRYRWRGAGTAFESLREYSSQDDIRWVDWKATARLSRPISRNYEVERHQQVVLLVDSSRAMSTFCGHRTKFDAMLEAAILVARAALGQGDGLGLVAFSDQVDAYLHPRRERAQLKAVLEHLYAKLPRLVEPNYEAALDSCGQAQLAADAFHSVHGHHGDGGGPPHAGVSSCAHTTASAAGRDYRRRNDRTERAAGAAHASGALSRGRRHRADV